MSDKVGMAIAELHSAENDLAAELLHASQRHKADHDIFYLGRDLARWSQEHVRELAAHGKNYGVELDAEPEDDTTLVAMIRQKSSELIGRRHDPALLLLRDLREIHRKAAGVSLDWEILAQTAQALKDDELLSLSMKCHPQTLRQMRWANAMLKSNAAQVMVTP
ncbi:hypothetical protein E0H75_40505 [Kribbella capetownensis]|uniref:Uncharacterized protein n=1 Tax=Kribbella capetownensis TaxID=1572659 RepID=A0A4R0IU47_9ACTN|nr:hypothetical protein [Kribbella capetownensis]TCC37431.1 hypothetical protein E0H75_40505 [Kribbella capetownensis]